MAISANGNHLKPPCRYTRIKNNNHILHCRYRSVVILILPSYLIQTHSSGPIAKSSSRSLRQQLVVGTGTFR